MAKIGAVPAITIEPWEPWAKWRCPECGDVCSDPYGILETMCHNGHGVILQIIHPDNKSGWRSAWKIQPGESAYA